MLLWAEAHFYPIWNVIASAPAKKCVNALIVRAVSSPGEGRVTPFVTTGLDLGSMLTLRVHDHPT
jgi:hypothetical protein